MSLSPVTFWSDDLKVTDEEFFGAIRRLKRRNTAPGPDGITIKAWALASTALAQDIKAVFNKCLRTGRFPTTWKVSNLVLIRKNNRAEDSPSAFRPICLLNDISKLFERILADRLHNHLFRVGPNISSNQFGFRHGRSTMDAIKFVQSLSDQAINGGGVALAVSIDIVNAFNSLSWNAIKDALTYHNFPSYLQEIVMDYLRDRYVSYMDCNQKRCQRQVSCGVPQGSVLGPLLWNIAYDPVLRIELPHGVYIICFADDTFILAIGNSFHSTKELAEIGIAKVVQKINSLGLQVAPHKTEALWFHKLPRSRDPPAMRIRVGDSLIQIGRNIKYLGLTLDSHWRFEEHFKLLVPKIEKIVGAMHRILPNLGGPREEVRRLYAGVVRSMVLYGAPVWYQKLLSVRRSRKRIYSLQRRIAIRMVRGYRTISFEAATILARFPPLDILAEMDARVYDRLRSLREANSVMLPNAIKRQERIRALDMWRDRLNGEQFAHKRVVEAVLPSFDDWLASRQKMTYRLTQVFTGHGCFRDYLCKIGREPESACYHCRVDVDSAQHTLEVCPAWDLERRNLVDEIGSDLSLATVVSAMLNRESAWVSVVSFCESVMTQKEAAERDRERSDPTRRVRRRRDNTARHLTTPSYVSTQ